VIPVVYENELCLVVNKPINMPAQKDFSRTLDMLSVVESYLGKKAFLIHRLDRHVAGPVVIAKTKASAAKLNKELQEHSMTKIYKAVVVHKSNLSLSLNKSRTLDHYHKKDKSIAIIISNKEFFELKDSDKVGFKPVKLKYKCLNTLTYDTMSLSLLEIELFTGRFHQIRSQFRYVDLPILGDPKYGESVFNHNKFTEIGLQSTTLKFKNPKDNIILTAKVEHFEGPFKLFQ